MQKLDDEVAVWLKVFGTFLLLLWIVWWWTSLRLGSLVGAQHLWTPAYHFLGVDFLHNYNVARMWLEGSDPYLEFSGAPLEIKYPYPPLVIRLFSWCGLVSPQTALWIWIVLLGSIVALGAWGAWRTRRELRLGDIPWVLICSATLFSTPVIFAIERGNHDMLILLFIFLAALFMRGRSWWRDILIGLFLSLAMWAKIYPGLLFLGLLALRRWRAAACFTVISGLMVLLDIEGTRHFIDNLSLLVAQTGQGLQEPVSTMRHALGASWHSFWTDTPLSFISLVPGNLAAVLLLLVPALWISFKIYQAKDSKNLAYPYLLWLAGLATFFPSISNDYNLIFLPLAAFALWDRRDTWYVHGMLGLFLLYWQPFQFPIGGKALLVIKLLGVYAVFLLLLKRTHECRTNISLESPQARVASSIVWRKYQWTRAVTYMAFVALLLFSTPTMKLAFSKMQSNQDAWLAYARTIEAVLPSRAAVLQLPFVPFLESSPNRSVANGYFWGHLFSNDLRWSYTVRGKEGHTWQNLLLKPFEEFVETLAMFDFYGISIDRSGYADSGAEIEKRLSMLLGVEPFVSVDHRLAFFNMTPFKQALLKKYSYEEIQEIKKAAYSPLIVEWGEGFYDLEGRPEGDNWRWAKSQAEFQIINPTTQVKNVSLEMGLGTLMNKKTRLYMSYDGIVNEIDLNGENTSYFKEIEINPGSNIFKILSNNKPQRSANDDRDLSFKVMDFRVRQEDNRLRYLDLK